jgi:hypothetical protein
MKKKGRKALPLSSPLVLVMRHEPDCPHCRKHFHQLFRQLAVFFAANRLPRVAVEISVLMFLTVNDHRFFSFSR